MPHRVYIVDDNELDLYYARLVIERNHPGVEVLTFDSAAEALQALRQSGAPPDLILLDINMPGMNGFEFLAAFDPPTAPVVMLTSSPDPVDRQQALSHASVRDYIVKPLEPDATGRLLGLGAA